MLKRYAVYADGQTRYNTISNTPLGITSMASDADLDDLITSNRIKVYVASYSTARTNAPSSWVGGIMLSLMAGSFAFQLCYSYGTSAVYMRTYYNGSFNSWVTL